jgi:hypothetical protein
MVPGQPQTHTSNRSQRAAADGVKAAIAAHLAPARVAEWQTHREALVKSTQFLIFAQMDKNAVIDRVRNRYDLGKDDVVDVEGVFEIHAYSLMASARSKSQRKEIKFSVAEEFAFVLYPSFLAEKNCSDTPRLWHVQLDSQMIRIIPTHQDIVESFKKSNKDALKQMDRKRAIEAAAKIFQNNLATARAMSKQKDDVRRDMDAAEEAHWQRLGEDVANLANLFKNATGNDLRRKAEKNEKS